ncbi:hypothetical protein GCM10018777_56640 [Streptomyces albogriseolus]|uniref:hypothetical protein n=1 Tax=Streptomyces TaxID=1883 RepID=UPI001675EC7F|nr:MULTISPECIES: hypothetical protein [Streptomyces]GHB14615.1 hypothetical protein GCM10010330_80370 [Streptomyces tendae]GHG33198.1 hypothetical protein GCM10018777_56640 [Streptomyces viridodiastaticus]
MSGQLGDSKPTAERVKHSGPDTKFCVLCLSGEHEGVDDAELSTGRSEGQAARACTESERTHP